MPLFRASAERVRKKAQHRRARNLEWMGSCQRAHDDGSVLSLGRMCLLSLANNMKEVWVKDYADNYLDHYTFRYIMGPFNPLPGELVEELTCLLCTTKQLSRAALHLLLVPQLRRLSLESCPTLVTPSLCGHIAARCQGLWSLDLSGAQQLPSKVLCETLHSLPALRSLSLAGMPCTRNVIQTVVHRCRLLQHLDVSRCHLLSPTALLPLGGGAFCPSSASPPDSCPQSLLSSSPPPLSPLPLRNLLALDIGFGEQEGDAAAAAAYLLLSLPGLERVAIEDLAHACYLIEHREFAKVDEFADREGVPRLGEVWRERLRSQCKDSFWKKRKVDEEDESEEEERMFWESYGCESEEDANADEGPSCSHNLKGLSESGFVLHLRDIKGITCDHLDSLARLCPDIHSISLNAELKDSSGRVQGSVLAAGLQAWTGQLRSLSLHYPHHLMALLHALRVAGSSLTSLTLEGVKTSRHSSLLDIIKACPRLRELLIYAEPPQWSNDQVEDGQQDDGNLPQLPDLCSLTLSFSHEHSQRRPAMSLMSLTKVLKCILNGSPLLEKLSLVSLPCPLNCVLQNLLQRVDLNMHHLADSSGLPPTPLGRVQHIDLQRTDVQIKTVTRILQRCTRLKFVDLSYCWQIHKNEWLDCQTLSKAQVVWVE